MDADGDDQPVAQPHGVPEHVQMAIGDGVEGAGIERDTGHKPVYPAPGGPASRTGSPPGPLFLLSPALNRWPGRGVFWAGRACFVTQAATKQNPGLTKPFSCPAKTSGNLRWVSSG